MAAVIETRGLSKKFGDRPVFVDLNLRIDPGERVALLGLNGAGKTTLLRCLMGVLSFDGDVTIGGLDVASVGARARRLMGYVPQRPPLFPMTLEATVEFFAAIRGIEASAVAERLEALGLPLATSGTLALRELSGGMLQKALLGIALAADPPVLLLDEPTANLDPRARADFLRALRTVGPETTILLASHRLDEVETVAERIWILYGGERVFDGSVDDLRARAGVEGWLWIRTVPDRRDEVRAWLGRRTAEGSVQANGTRVGARLPPAERAAALYDLQHAGLPIRDFWVERPSLEEIVERFFAARGS